MSVYFYDKAIVDRIREVIKDPLVHIINNEKMFTKSHDENDDPSMPAISIYREGYSLSTLNKNISMLRQGRTEYSSALKGLFATQSIPISIRYQVDVWTRTREQNDEFVKDLIWFFSLFPEHQLLLKYNQFERRIGFNVFMGDDIVDNSDLNEFEDRGQYYRSTFNLLVDEAQFFLVREAKVYQNINLIVKSYDMEGVEFDSETILNQSDEP